MVPTPKPVAERLYNGGNSWLKLSFTPLPICRKEYSELGKEVISTVIDT